MTPPRTVTLEWQQLQQRLARAAQATHDAFQLSPERTRALLEKRARLLARVPPQAPAAAEVLPVVTFTLADERLAVETACVCEVLRPRELTPVPGVPLVLAGLHNLRGHVLPVFDLRRLFGLPPGARPASPWVIVLGRERPELGVLADQVQEVTALRIDEMLEPPASVAGIARTYLRGVTADALLILAGVTLLQDPQLTLDQEGDAAV